MAGGGSAESETEEDVDRTSDGEKAVNRQGEKEHRGDDEEDLESDDLGAEVVLEDVVALPE